MDSNQQKVPGKGADTHKNAKKESQQKNPPKSKKKPIDQEKNPHKKFWDCMVDEFFLTANFLSVKDLEELKQAVKNWNFNKCVRTLKEYLKPEDKLQKTLKQAHMVIIKCIDDNLNYVLLQGYLEILALNVKKVKVFCNMEEILKLQNDIHDNDYPYFCECFGLKIPNQKVDKLLETYAQKGVFGSGFKLIEVSGSQKNLKRIDILVNGARKDELKDIVTDLKKLGFSKKDYPDIHEDLLVDGAMFFYRKEGYEYAEQIFRPYPFVLARVVERMIRDKKLDEALSVCHRNPEVIRHIKNSKRVQNQVKELKTIIANPLQTNTFGPSNSEEFITFAEYNLTKKDVLFLNENHPGIEKNLQSLFSAPVIGIDTESLVARTKFDSDMDLVATLQIANQKQAYLLDPVKANKPNIVKYLKEFVSNPEKTIVGHTVDDDLNLLLKSFGITEKKCKVIELKTMFQVLYPEEKKGLANMCAKVLGKPICKKYTLTDWGRRPLLLNQVHYAAMDAFIVIILLNKMQKMLEGKKVE